MTLPLIDADGNPVTCAAIDIAGNPDDFSPPVVTADATGALVWAEGAAATASVVGPRTNWEVMLKLLPDAMQSELVSASRMSFKASDDDIGMTNKATVIGGVEYYAYTYAGNTTLDAYFDTVDQMFNSYNDHVGEAAPHVTMARLAGEAYIYCESAPIGSYIMDMRLADVYSDYGNPQFTDTSVLTYDVSVIHFDSVSYNSTTQQYDMVNPVVTSTTPQELLVHLSGGNTAVDYTRMVSFEDYHKTRRHLVPAEVTDSRPFIIAGSNALIDGAPLGAAVAVTSMPRFCLPA